MMTRDLLPLLLLFSLCAFALSLPFSTTATLGNKAGQRKFTFVHVTDVHGHVLADRHTEDSADFGDFASLLEHLGTQAATNSSNLFLFDSGDLIEGTGLSDATDVHGQYIFDVAESIPYTGLTIGNHDIGHASTTELMMAKDGFISHWNGRYLAANSLYIPAHDATMGAPYEVITTDDGSKILALGFLYNFDHNADNTIVDTVDVSLTHPYFAQAMKEAAEVDAIVVTCHIDAEQEELDQIYTAVRAVHASTPLVFFTGHAHQLKYRTLDDNAFAIESGKYFENIGYITFETSKTGSQRMLNLEWQWVNATKTKLQNLAGVPATEFETKAGTELRKTMNTYFAKLGLDEQEGCAPQTFNTDSDFDAADSFYGLYVKNIIPEIVFNQTLASETTPFFICNLATLRAPLYKGVVLFDDIFTIAPFKDCYYYYHAIEGSHLQALLDKIKEDRYAFGRMAARYLGVSEADTTPFVNSPITPVAGTSYDLICADYDCHTLGQILDQMYPSTYTASLYPTAYSSTTALSLYVRNHFKC